MAEQTPFGAWLQNSGRKQVDVAKELDVSASLVCEWASGKRTPTLAHAPLIEMLTDGEVPVEAFGYRLEHLKAAARVVARRQRRAREAAAQAAPPSAA